MYNIYTINMKKSELHQIIKEEIHKVLNENNLPSDIQVFKDGNYIDIESNSGEYTGEIKENGKVSFSVIYDDLDEEFTDYNWRDILGPNHAFVKIIDSIGGDVEAIDDYVMITVDASKLI
jgi:hypothetical protein